MLLYCPGVRLAPECQSARLLQRLNMDSDWLTGLLVVFMVTIAVGLLWSGTMFGKVKEEGTIIFDLSC